MNQLFEVSFYLISKIQCCSVRKLLSNTISGRPITPASVHVSLTKMQLVPVSDIVAFISCGI